MALIEDMFKANAVTGVAVGLAAIVLAPTLIPTIGRVLRPAAKTVIKGGMILYRETMAGISELTTDLVAEARSELEGDGHDPGGRRSSIAAAASHTSRESSREKH
jgi:hypothetical protein